MCRSIKTLRPPYVEAAGDDDVRAAALQYVRKISGFRAPGARNVQAFDEAVDAVAAATRELLDRLQVRPSSTGRRSWHPRRTTRGGRRGSEGGRR